jgi:hypothetical protein
MGQILLKGCLLLAVFCVGAAACTKSAPSVSPSSGVAPVTIPTARTISEPVTYGFYDGHIDTMLSTDVSDKAQATAQHINYSAALITQSPGTYPSLYMIIGHAAPNQPFVFGSEPGESDYSPLWQEVDVRWKTGVKPVLLVRDDQIKALASKGELTIDPTQIVLDCPIAKVGTAHSVPATTAIAEPVTYGYYDGHIDTMLSTDVSSKPQAKAKHINYSAALITRSARVFPSLYTIVGRAAPNQPVVFGSEPGESDYSPVWREINVIWKAGVKPVLLVKDDQIKELASKGELSIDPTQVALNRPIVKVT